MAVFLFFYTVFCDCLSSFRAKPVQLRSLSFLLHWTCKTREGVGENLTSALGERTFTQSSRTAGLKRLVDAAVMLAKTTLVC